MRKQLIFIAACFICSGCATGYQSKGLSGGYTDMDLGGGKYLVSFSGNGFTKRDGTQKYAIQRARELCETQGMGFEILQIGGDTSSHMIGSASSNCSSSYGYGYGQTNCRHNGQTRVNKHTAEVIVQCANGDHKASAKAQN